MPREASKSGRSGRSNKTARVMNLLIDPEAAAESSAAPDGSAGSGASVPAARAKRTANDENTQEQIRNALETELTGFAAPAPQETAEEPEAAPVIEQAQTPPQPAAEPAPSVAAPEPPAQDTSAPLEQPAPLEEAPRPEPAAPAPLEQPAPLEEAPRPEPAAPAPLEQPAPLEEAPRPEPAAPALLEQPAPLEEAPRPEPAASAPEEPADAGDNDDEDNDDDYICFNVTQALVEDKADKYMNMFGMCTCNRCRIDVIALALSNLPAKYVVAKPKDMIPRLSMYESKYSAAVITQVMKACTKVVELPHHKR